jgi:glycosyltransferase involved in cell wall biosynthesis
MSRNLKIFFSCSGIGIMNRGIESFFREAFDGLRGTPGLQITLYKGAGQEDGEERRIWNLPRTGRPAKVLGAAIRRNGYVAEQLSTFLPMVREIRRHKPDIIFYSDSNLGFQLYRWRKWIGAPFRLLFSNGGPCGPPFPRTDFIHQVAPYYLDQALRAGVSPGQQRMVPYGIKIANAQTEFERTEKSPIRERLGLPKDRKIVLSVGWISAIHKRMDYLVREVAELPEPRPYLVMLGAIDSESKSILALARESLGSDGYLARSVPYEQVADYYRAADLFALCSLREGFGRVYLEALLQGLSCLVHDHPVMRFVLGEDGIFADLSYPGTLAAALNNALKQPSDPWSMTRRRENVRRRFSWPVLAPLYLRMFRDCMAARRQV